MTAMDNEGTVRITLKDVYQMTQSLEKSFTDALTALNLTMLSIKGHIDSQDKRNSAVDLLQAEHGIRLASIQTVLDQAQPLAMKNDFENRIRLLERFKYTLLGAVVVINSAAAAIEYFATHH